jgi:hypothetical protein
MNLRRLRPGYKRLPNGDDVLKDKADFRRELIEAFGGHDPYDPTLGCYSPWWMDAPG